MKKNNNTTYLFVLLILIIFSAFKKKKDAQIVFDEPGEFEFPKHTTTKKPQTIKNEVITKRPVVKTIFDKETYERQFDTHPLIDVNPFPEIKFGDPIKNFDLEIQPIKTFEITRNIPDELDLRDFKRIQSKSKRDKLQSYSSRF